MPRFSHKGICVCTCTHIHQCIYESEFMVNLRSMTHAGFLNAGALCKCDVIPGVYHPLPRFYTLPFSIHVHPHTILPRGSDTCHLFIFEDLPMQGDKGAPYLILMSLRTAKAPQAASCGVARVCSGGNRLYFCRRLFFMYVRSFKPGCLFMFVVAVCSGGGIFLAFCCAWKTYKLQLAEGESTSVFPE